MMISNEQLGTTRFQRNTRLRQIGIICCTTILPLSLGSCAEVKKAWNEPAITIDSYLTDTTNVTCDGRRTIADLKPDTSAWFITHTASDNAKTVIVVERKGDQVAVSQYPSNTQSAVVPSDLKFSSLTPIVEGPESAVSTSGATWLIDAKVFKNKPMVSIQGSC